MKEILERLFAHGRLSREEAKSILQAIAVQKFPVVQTAAFLAAYRMRPPVAQELSGFRDALLELCLAVDLSGYDCIDVCGTGGDNKQTFNISTITALVLAGAGVSVAKHGNYAVSSNCGSSNVLEALGVPLPAEAGAVRKQLETCGICFIHAPFFHPALKSVAPIRKELGVRTFFNILGPLVNPARPKYQLVGVFSPELLRLYSHVLQQGEQCYMIVHGLDGYDEVSLTSTVKIIRGRREELYEPHELGFERLKDEEHYGGSSIEEARRIFISILEGDGTEAQNNVVIANAGLALACRESSRDLEGCFLRARESLESKKALHVLKRLTDSC